MAVDLLVNSTKFPRVLLNELLVRPGFDSTLPNRRGRSLEKEQLASESSKPSIERCDVAPLHHGRTQWVRCKVSTSTKHHGRSCSCTPACSHSTVPTMRSRWRRFASTVSVPSSSGKAKGP